MAKTIKFNLKCDDKPIRKIEDLQNNFSIEDVLAHFHNGNLERWLQVRGHQDYLDKVSKIDKSKGNIEIISQLIKIFDVSKDENEIKEAVSILTYSKEKQEKLDRYENLDFQKEIVIQDYLNEYKELISKLQNTKDITIIKDCIKKIADNYFELFKLNYRFIFWTLLKNLNDIIAIKEFVREMTDNYFELFKLNYSSHFEILRDIRPIAIMCLLMNENMRDYCLPKKVSAKPNNGTGLIILDDIETVRYGDEKYNQEMKNKKDRYNSICNLITYDFLNNSVQMGYIKSISKTENYYWNDIEPKGKKCMIISINRKSDKNNIDKLQSSISFYGGPDGRTTFDYYRDDYYRVWSEIEELDKAIEDDKKLSNMKIIRSIEGSEEFSENDINKRFVILDGISYQNDNSDNRILYYMEV